MNKTAATIAIAVGLTIGITPIGIAVAAQPATICPPTGAGWVKTDGVTGQTAQVDAPTGYLIAEVCYKAGPNATTYTVTPSPSVVIVSSLLNNGGQIADLSHYSVRLVPVPEPTPTPTPPPPPEPTPPPVPPTDPPVPPTDPPVPPTDPPVDTPEPTLPNTGLDPWVWIALAALAIAAGIPLARRARH